MCSSTESCDDGQHVLFVSKSQVLTYLEFHATVDDPLDGRSSSPRMLIKGSRQVGHVRDVTANSRDVHAVSRGIQLLLQALDLARSVCASGNHHQVSSTMLGQPVADGPPDAAKPANNDV
jgi:hypothetical protein